MTFTVNDLMDLKRLLLEHPEWQMELRQLMLTEELLALPTLVSELAQAQARTEQRLEELAQAQTRTEQGLEKLEATVQELAQAQARTEQRLEKLEATVQELAQAQARTEQRLEKLEATVQELAQAQARTEQRLEELAQAQARTEKSIQWLADRQGRMMGTLLEQKYAQHAAGYFGHMLRRVRVVLPHGLDAAMEDTLETRLTLEELRDLLLLDLLVVGWLRQAPDAEPAEVWLVVEVAAAIDGDDVERARRRAALLQKAGYRAIPVVAGESVTPAATEALQKAAVVLALDGRSQGWVEALGVT
jgi:hypothetical protein